MSFSFLKQSRLLAVFVLLSFLMSFSLALVVPSATADETSSESTTVVDASESFAMDEVDSSGLIDEVEVMQEQLPEPVLVEWTWEMRSDPALGNPILILSWDDGTMTATSGTLTNTTAGEETYTFVVSHAGTPVSATVEFEVTVVEETPAVAASNVEAAEFAVQETVVDETMTEEITADNNNSEGAIDDGTPADDSSINSTGDSTGDSPDFMS